MKPGSTQRPPASMTVASAGHGDVGAHRGDPAAVHQHGAVERIPDNGTTWAPVMAMAADMVPTVPAGSDRQVDGWSTN